VGETEISANPKRQKELSNSSKRRNPLRFREQSERKRKGSLLCEEGKGFVNTHFKGGGVFGR